jgi:hypothetical protein
LEANGLGKEVLGLGPGGQGWAGAAASYEDDEDDDVFDDDEGDGEVPVALRPPYRVATARVFADASAVLHALQVPSPTQILSLFLDPHNYDPDPGMQAEEVSLRRAEGAKMAYAGATLFVDGEAYTLPAGCEALGPLLCDARALPKARVTQHGVDVTHDDAASTRFLLALLEAGYVYPVDA